MAMIKVSQKEKSTHKYFSGNYQSTYNNLNFLGLAPLILQGHEEVLFKQHLSFTNSKTVLGKPIRGISMPLSTLVTINFAVESVAFFEKLDPLIEILSILNLSDSSESSDVYILNRLMKCFVPLSHSFTQVYLENATSNCVAGGRIDCLVGKSSNGNRPNMTIAGNNGSESLERVYLGSVAEAKTIDVHSCSKVSAKEPLDSVEELKTLNQPMMEIMALSEVCTFPNTEIPLICIYGNRSAYRPLLYFKEYDVLLTTTKPSAFYDSDEEEFHVTGLAFLHLLFQLHEYPFNKEELNRLSKTGWKAAKNISNCTAYTDSQVSLESEPKASTSRNPNITQPFFHDNRSILGKRRTEKTPTNIQKKGTTQ